DENLVMASRKGDKSAYALLVRRHYKHVFIVCLGVAGNIEDAEDATQEAMLKGYLQLKKLRNSSQFGPWITKIARNLCLNIIHRKQRTREILADKATRPIGIRSENERLQQAIGDLPLEIRQPLVLYFFDDQNVQTVASNLKVSTSVVYSRLRIAINELHRLLDGQGETNE
ncbi:RNA polymerase sigma factor, partial [Planctomycetota bacterium]